MEEPISENEAYYRAILDAFDGLIYVCSQDYRIEFMNDPMKERTGYDATGQLCYKALHDLKSVCPWCVNEQVFTGKKVQWDIQSPKDGRWYHVSNTPVYRTNRPISKQAVIIDITERKEAEQKIALLNFALNSVREAAFLIDQTARFQYVNEEACRILGYQREELLLMGVPDIDPDFPFERWASHWHFMKERSSDIFESRHKTKDNRIFPVEINVIHFEFDRQSYHLALARDVTDRKNAVDALREYAEQVRSFSARLVEARELERRSIARELHDETGQRLTGINFELAQIKQITADDSVRKRISAVQQEMGELMVKLTDLTSSLRPILLDDEGVLPALEWHIKKFIAQTGIDVEFMHSGMDTRFKNSVELTIFRIAQESLTNIFRHAQATLVRIRMFVNETEALMTISDNGIGFDPVEAIVNRRTMGLIGMRERIEEIGGSFSIRSSAGTGSEISITLPLK